MRKVILGIFLSAILSAAFFPSRAQAAPSNSAQAAILIHADTGQVLFSKNADSRMLIASTTKIMTALVVLQHCSPDEQVKILPEYTSVEGSSMYLKAGETYTVRDLLYGMLLVSGNDAATALACHCGGSIAGFAQMMNDEAAQLGLCNSSFKNPHGLDADDHYSSAEDLAIITSAAMKIPLFAQIVGTKSYTLGEQTYINHNKLLWNCEGTLGVKTGYTTAAGRSLVSCAERDGLKLICVTLSDPDDWEDHKALYDWGFAAYAYKNVLPMGTLCELPVISGEKQAVGITAAETTRVLVEKAAKLDLKLELPEFVYAGVKAGDCAGRVFVLADSTVVGEFPLSYTEDVGLADDAKLTPWERFRRTWYMMNKYGFIFQGKD